MFSFVDKNGRTVDINATIANRSPERGGQSGGYQSGDELVKELLNKYVPDSEFISRP